MTELQEKMFKMFSWFHNFCTQNNLRYYAVGGTALGAVRHQGFIPWDDDMDVGMPRRDYNKLIELMKNKTEFAPYTLETPLEKNDFVYPYCKLYDTTTTLIENTRYKTKRGIYIDVFPLDGAGNSLAESKKRFRLIDGKINLLSTKTCALSSHRKLYKNLAIMFLRCIPECILSWKKIVRQINVLGEELVFDDCVYVSNFVGNWHEKEIMKREWFGEPRLVKFENAEMYIPQDYDAYLTQLYGNYMQLPPEEKRKSHHDYLYQNLNESYIEI